MRRLLFRLLLVWSCLAIDKAIIASEETTAKSFTGLNTKWLYIANSTAITDTIPGETANVEEVDTIVYYNVNPASFKFSYDTINTKLIQSVPNITIAQMVKGAASGVYVQEVTGEPGSVHQNIYIRGVSRPLLNQKDLYLSQPAIYINGMPLIQDNPYVYNIQTYNVSPIGPATDLLSILEQDNIEKIDVVKDFKDLGVLGPRASNGAIYITTKNAKPGEKLLSINSYFGYALTPAINTTNAYSDKNFRLPFYYKYGSSANLSSLPAYLSDSSNADYYGASNWSDLYYKNAPVYNINASLTGGSGRSNFRAFFGATQNASTANATDLRRYVGSFYISMVPAKWLTVSSMVSGSLLKRNRNRSFTDRFAEMRYLPSIANPIPPNKNVYQRFTDIYEGDLIDDNLTSSVQGYFSLSANIGKAVNTARMSFDYNEGKRDVFYPKALFSGNNYVSNYFGFNQRFVLEDKIEYTHRFGNASLMNLNGGFNYQADISRYSYIQGYNGPDDVKRIAEVDGTTTSSGYLVHNGYLVSGYLDKIQQRLISFWGNARYKMDNGLEIGALLRSDGSSSMQPNHRWFVSPVFDVKYDIVKDNVGFLSLMDLHASWGRVGDLVSDQSISAGPQYVPQLSWGGFPLASFNGYGTYTRPYNNAWIGYDIPWSYAEQFSIGTQLSFLNKRISLKIDVYNKDNKDLTLTVPTTAESGYTYELKSGMHVNNKGLDFTIDAHIVPINDNGFGWNASLNGTYNQNKLKALPDGSSSIILNGHKLETGFAVDAFWLLQNEGIYNNSSEIPTGFTYKGQAFNAGDPIWKDIDGDNVINDNDKVLKGNALPKFFGGLINQVTYKKFDLNFHLQYALGHYIMNQEAANYMDFITRDNSESLDAIKEVTYWEDRINTGSYPMYNPWSSVNGYQVNQDLFLEKANYLSLRSATIGYKMIGKNQLGFGKAKGFRDLYLYITGTNLLKFSPYTNRDPELANYYGYDNGLSLPLTKSVIVGIKLNL
ncbi:Plug domain-containing protein [Niabella ginsengisoli]|uniref:Plug domain-containing protein n=1 Tax=Niabella ginsengisoli TaxID=522298 RepID=A0ABS9SIY3_9BACT|nr:Plug domain-containing protein [Niabella ginsengisoli]MCH5598314.1 Plug domain-containing protein [Niabella ginsengisoli]